MTRGQGPQQAPQQGNDQPDTAPEPRETVELNADPRTPLEVSPGVTITLLRDHPTQVVVERPAVAHPV